VPIRRATEADEAALKELWEEFEAEAPEPAGPIPMTWDEEWADERADLAGGALYVAEDDEGVVGMARASAPVRGLTHVAIVHVRPRARRQGIAKALLAACVEEMKGKGATVVGLNVVTTNAAARTVWHRLGFEEVQVGMTMPLETLERRLGDTPTGPSQASTHVQTDDQATVDRALAQFVPRLDSADVRATANGWLRIADPLLDGDRELQHRVAAELSVRVAGVVVALGNEHGAVVRFRLYERGRMVDEYLSVPLYYGELSKGDELALAANPTLVARLTGANREEVHRVARVAATTAELPPAAELYEQIARTLGLEP
jgi:ribosomal protein S18 acetylase RimI-like enzyme